jgi:putative SOS response-associated peptidase YedK
LVPVDNFYWQKTESGGKQPNAIALAGRGIMALAGLWENWRSPAGEWGSELHDRHLSAECAFAPSFAIGCR